MFRTFWLLAWKNSVHLGFVLPTFCKGGFVIKNKNHLRVDVLLAGARQVCWSADMKWITLWQYYTSVLKSQFIILVFFLFFHMLFDIVLVCFAIFVSINSTRFASAMFDIPTPSLANRNYFIVYSRFCYANLDIIDQSVQKDSFSFKSASSSLS